MRELARPVASDNQRDAQTDLFYGSSVLKKTRTIIEEQNGVFVRDALLPANAFISHAFCMKEDGKTEENEKAPKNATCVKRVSKSNKDPCNIHHGHYLLNHFCFKNPGTRFRLQRSA